MTEPGELQRFDTHLCLVSQQATPNLVPVLDAGFRPRRVVMVVTPDMRQRAQWLEDTLRPRAAVQVERIDVQDAWDMHGIIDTLVGWLDKQPADARIALNVTGGTKPMAMAAQQVFAMAGRPVFYLHQARAEVQWLEPRLPPRALANRLSLDDYLHAHGWEVLQRPAAPCDLLERPVAPGQLPGRAVGLPSRYLPPGTPERVASTRAGLTREPGPLASADIAERLALSGTTVTGLCAL
jgi:hypothetical protein